MDNAQQIEAQFRLQERGAQIKRLAKHGLIFVKIAGHAHMLRALAGEEEGELIAPVRCHALAGEGCGFLCQISHAIRDNHRAAVIDPPPVAQPLNERRWRDIAIGLCPCAQILRRRLQRLAR